MVREPVQFLSQHICLVNRKCVVIKKVVGCREESREKWESSSITPLAKRMNTGAPVLSVESKYLS